MPTQLQRLLDAPSAETLAALRRFNGILLGGGPASPELLAAARDAGVRVITTYGSAETCGGCVYDGFPLEDVLARVDGDGRILLGGATLAAGYLGEAGPAADDFFEEDGVRWYRTGDLGSIDATGKLTVLGRADDVIITGGVKVSATHVQAELEKLDGVTAAFVAGVPSEEWGQAVAAYVAVEDSSPAGIEGFTAQAARWPGPAGAENRPRCRRADDAAQRQTGPAGHDCSAGRAASGKIEKPRPGQRAGAAGFRRV